MVVRYKLVGKKAATNMVNKPAPEFTPIILGLARELLSTDCRITPETANAQPARTAARVLGILTYIIIL